MFANLREWIFLQRCQLECNPRYSLELAAVACIAGALLCGACLVIGIVHGVL